MAEKFNLAGKIESLPPELKAVIALAGKLAQKRRVSLYLVGGVVRDLLLGRATGDIDMAADRDVIGLAGEISQATGGKLTRHERFGTAKIQYSGFSFDLATLRAEEYRRSGALPTVKPGTLEDDLFRRDFTVNAMAVSLAPDRYGELADIYGGRKDLEQKLIRVLHGRSFIDDATRIWRALRYQQRLGFKIESGTLKLLKRDINMLDTITGDRIRYELECVFVEAGPEKVLQAAARLGVLQKMHPSLIFDRNMAQAFRRAREATKTNPPNFNLYIALLASSLNEPEAGKLADYLHLTKTAAGTLKDLIQLKRKLARLEKLTLKPSQVYRLLEGYTPAAIIACSVISSTAAKRHMEHYLNSYRYVRPVLNGNDLLALGVKTGPEVKEMLSRLRDVRLDGGVTDKRGEIARVKRWLDR